MPHSSGSRLNFARRPETLARAPESAALYLRQPARRSGRRRSGESQRITSGRMSGLNGLFGVGSNALASFQRAMSVTGQTSRMSAPLAIRARRPSSPRPFRKTDAPGQIGTGVRSRKSAVPSTALLNSNLLNSNERIGQFGASEGSLTNSDSGLTMRTIKASRQGSTNSSRRGRMSRPIPPI